MAVVEQADAVQRLDALDLLCKRLVVGLMERLAPLLDLLHVRLLALLVDRLALEIDGGAEARGVLTGIEARPRRVTVGVDEVARESGPHDGRARQQLGIEMVDMPVGIGQGPAALVEAPLQACGDVSAHMRLRQNYGAGALQHDYRGSIEVAHGACSNAGKRWWPASSCKRPALTRAAPLARSGAR